MARGSVCRRSAEGDGWVTGTDEGRPLSTARHAAGGRLFRRSQTPSDERKTPVRIPAPDAREVDIRVADLLDRDHFGERWRYWPMLEGETGSTSETLPRWVWRTA